MPLTGSKAVQPRSSIQASAQAWRRLLDLLAVAPEQVARDVAGGMPTERAAAMKMWVKSWQTPWPRRGLLGGGLDPVARCRTACPS
jgi:hypothetical protein